MAASFMSVRGPNDGTFDANMLSKPKRPEFVSSLSMQDPRALNQFRAEALRTGPSTWANLSRGRQGILAQDARDSAAREVAGRGAQARSLLAMRGGLDSGARERIARGGARDLMEANQNIARQGLINDAQIGINDEANRIQQLSMVPSLQNTASGEAAARNEFNMNAFNQDMAGWAARQTAQAIERADK